MGDLKTETFQPGFAATLDADGYISSTANGWAKQCSQDLRTLVNTAPDSMFARLWRPGHIQSMFEWPVKQVFF